jgi:predicted SnoaL-like aldol condensation-catalyzing enzyme
MRKFNAISIAVAAAIAVAPLGTVSQAQEAVTPATDVESLFTDPDPQLHANKQAAYHIMKDLLEAGHWDQSGRYMTDKYIQHNPNVASGRQSVVDFFKGLGVQPKPIPERLSAPVVQVVAQGNYVVVVTVSTLPTPSDPSKTYTTSWFDMWRFVDGKADEHWDSATLMR